jgi:MinD superfamily P-loop ATPase
VPLFRHLGEEHRLQRAKRVVFFSLKGGVGRTTLSVELACWLARFGTPGGAGPGPLRVAIVDADPASPSVALRLGIPQPIRPPSGAGMETVQLRVMHRSGVQVLCHGSAPFQHHGLDTRLIDDLDSLDDDRFDVCIVDVAADLGTAAVALQQADDILVVITPTASGVHDTYRTTEALRRAGLRDRLACVVNRARVEADVSVTVGDLGLRVVAEVPEDPAVLDAEDTHSPRVLGEASGFSRAIGDVARFVTRCR